MDNTLAMHAPIPPIPWNTPALWQAANDHLARDVARNRHRLTDAFELANSLKSQLVSLSPLMDWLCGKTCPACTDNCCRRARVWADFRDLLFYHLAEIPVPDGQPLSQPGQRCRHASPRGCRIDRLRRPFICTWYVCPDQTNLLRARTAEHERVTATLQQIKTQRRLMEDRFIRAITTD